MLAREKSDTQVGFNINTWKGTCPAPQAMAPQRRFQFYGSPANTGPCSQQPQKLTSNGISGSSTYSLGFTGNREKFPQAKSIFSTSWMEVCNIPLHKKQNKIN